MSKKLGRNDPCWCGSGRKYKHCHLKRSKDDPVTIQEVLTQIKKSFGKKYCLHPRKSQCKGDIVKAHTIQRNGGLSQIARDGHIYNFGPSFPNLAKGKAWTEPEETGIGLASTFTGFCGFHDNKTFEPIENNPFQISEHHTFLLAYRALCQEIFKKRAMLELVTSSKGFDKGKTKTEQIWMQRYLKLWESSVAVGLRDGNNYKRHYDEALMRSDYSMMQYYSIELENTPQFLCSGLISPEYDFFGNELQDFLDFQKVLDHISFSIIATDAGGAAVFGWLGTCEASKNFIRSLDAISDSELPDAIARFIFQQLENVYIAPDWWDALNPSVKVKISQRATAIDLQADSLQDDGTQYVSWKVTSRDTNIRL
jgi:hypothetical protein